MFSKSRSPQLRNCDNEVIPGTMQILLFNQNQPLYCALEFWNASCCSKDFCAFVVLSFSSNIDQKCHELCPIPHCCSSASSALNITMAQFQIPNRAQLKVSEEASNTLFGVGSPCLGLRACCKHALFGNLPLLNFYACAS